MTQSVPQYSVRPWVMTTPLGIPVVPEVKRMSDTSSVPASFRRRSTSAMALAVARAAKPSQDSAPSGTLP